MEEPSFKFGEEPSFKLNGVPGIKTICVKCVRRNEEYYGREYDR